MTGPLLALAIASGAAMPPQTAEVRRLARQSILEYNAGDFDLALRDAKRAYEMSGAPALLFNLGQCHRALGHWKEAEFFYRGYLREKKDVRNRREVLALIANMEAKQAAPPPPSPTATARATRAPTSTRTASPPPPPAGDAPNPPFGDAGETRTPLPREAGEAGRGGVRADRGFNPHPGPPPHPGEAVLASGEGVSARSTTATVSAPAAAVSAPTPHGPRIAAATWWLGGAGVAAALVGTYFGLQAGGLASKDQPVLVGGYTEHQLSASELQVERQDGLAANILWIGGSALVAAAVVVLVAAHGGTP